MAELVRVEEASVAGVAVIRLDRPKVNALSTQLCTELHDAAAEVEGRSDIRSVVVWGGPRVFAAGVDITEFPRTPEDRDPGPMVVALNRALLRIESLPQITVAAVNGYALGGGCELSLATDFRVCGTSARFGLPEILLGIIPGGGGTQRLPRLIGMTRAKDLVYSGRQVDADEALAIGLVSSVHPDDAVLDAAVELAGRYATGPASLTEAKRALQGGITLPIAEAIELEKRHFAASFRTEDSLVGVNSFLEQGPGKAAFTGR